MHRWAGRLGQVCGIVEAHAPSQTRGGEVAAIGRDRDVPGAGGAGFPALVAGGGGCLLFQVHDEYLAWGDAGDFRSVGKHEAAQQAIEALDVARASDALGFPGPRRNRCGHCSRKPLGNLKHSSITASVPFSTPRSSRQRV
jgi:hypothetical protein